MATATKVTVDLKEDKATIQTAISSLKKSMSDFKVERKSEWKTFKNKFNEDMDRVEKSLKKLTSHPKNKI